MRRKFRDRKISKDNQKDLAVMATIWHTMATRDVRLLRHQLQQIEHLPSNCIFQNYLRCHDDIGWGLER